MFQALCKRRNIRIKYDRYANALTAAAVYNVNRSKPEDPMLTAFDFVRDEESARKREELSRLKKFIQGAVGRVPFGTPREKIQEIRLKVIEQLKQQGRNDAEELFNQVWPTLSPKETECPK